MALALCTLLVIESITLLKLTKSTTIALQTVFTLQPKCNYRANIPIFSQTLQQVGETYLLYKVGVFHGIQEHVKNKDSHC